MHRDYGDIAGAFVRQHLCRHICVGDVALRGSRINHTPGRSRRAAQVQRTQLDSAATEPTITRRS